MTKLADLKKKLMENPEFASEYAKGIEEGLNEALAWSRGEIALKVVSKGSAPVERFRTIRTKAPKPAK